MNELQNTNSVQAVIEKAQEHAEHVKSLVIQTDDDFKAIKKEKAKANSLVKAIASKITETRKKALELVDEEISEYTKAKDLITENYADFFSNVDEEIKKRQEQQKKEWLERVNLIISDKSLSITKKDVTEDIFKATKNLKTDKKLTDLLLELQEQYDIKQADIQNIKEKAVSFELSPNKYVAMLDEGIPATTTLMQIEKDAKALKAEALEIANKKAEQEQQERARIEAEKEAIREREEELLKQAELLEAEKEAQKQSEKEKAREAILENKKLKLQGKTKITMEIVYEKTPENSKKLNESLKAMKEIAEVTLKKGE